MLRVSEEPSWRAEVAIRQQLHAHIEGSLYPEYAHDLDAVLRAIVLCACGQTEVELRARGYPTRACVVVSVLDLWGFVQARVKGRWN